MAKRIDVKDLNVYYGDVQGRRGRHDDHRAAVGDRLHRPVRLRQVDLPAHPQPDARGDPRRPRRGRGPARRRGPLRPRRRPGRRAPHDRHGVPAAQPVPDDVDLRQRRRRPAAQRRASTRSAIADDVVEQSLRGANLWNEVKDRLEQARRRPVRRPAAAAVHRPRHRRRAAGAADGRAVLGARPDLDAGDRGPDHRAEEPVHDRHRHPQHAAGGPGLGPHGVLQPRRRRASPAGWSRWTTPRRSSPTRPSRRPRTTSPAASAEPPGDGSPPRAPPEAVHRGREGRRLSVRALG